MRKVLRMKKGDKITLFDGQGNEYQAEIEFLTKDKVEGNITSREKKELEETRTFVLGQGLPRAGKLDDIIRMNTEVGVSGFVLFASDYSQVKVGDYSDSKIERLARVAEEAARQSERPTVPLLEGPMDFSDALVRQEQIKLILHSRDVEGSQDINEIKATLKPDDSIIILVGPEGGFSDVELAAAKENGFITVHMNLPILRTETAGIAASAILLS